MVKMIKKKAKAIVPIGSKPVVRLGATKRYTKTHWITPLSDTQKFFIATTTDMPHTYKGLPLSKGNEVVVAQYKNTSENYKRWVIRNKEFSAELEHASKVKKNLNQAMESMRRSTAPLKKASEAIAKEYQELGRKLRFKEEEIVSLLFSLSNKATIGIVVNDLQRSEIAYGLFKLLGIVISNYMIKQDGLTSILRAFKREDLEHISKKLNLKSQIGWKWAFRYQWLIFSEASSVKG